MFKVTGFLSSDLNSDLDLNEKLTLTISQDERLRIENMVKSRLPNVETPIFPTQNKYVNNSGVHVVKFKALKFPHCSCNELVTRDDGAQETIKRQCILPELINRHIIVELKPRKYSFVSRAKASFGMRISGLNFVAHTLCEI